MEHALADAVREETSALPLAGGNATLAVAEPPTREYVPMSRPEASMGSLR